MGKLPPDKAVVAGVVPREVKEELIVLQRELELPNLSKTVAYVLAAWHAERKARDLSVTLERGPGDATTVPAGSQGRKATAGDKEDSL